MNYSDFFSSVELPHDTSMEDGFSDESFSLPHMHEDESLGMLSALEFLKETESLDFDGVPYFLKEFFSNITFNLTNPRRAFLWSPHLIAFETVIRHLDYYFVPIVIIIGIVGNTLSFIVFVFTHLKRNSCHIYLASLALSDNLFLFCVFISWSEKIGISLHTQMGWCQTQVYLTHVASFLSAWYVVAFTFERYLVTCHPLMRSKLCTTKVAKVVVISLAVFGLTAYSYTLFTSGIMLLGINTLCGPLPQYFKVVSTINNIDTLFILIVPVVIIIGCNIRITYVVYHFYKQYRKIPKRPIQKWE